MPFNRSNLAGTSEFSPGTNNRSENHPTRAELLAHTENDGTHVSIEDRMKWNSIEKKLKEYVDYQFKNTIGKFNFESIGLSNSLTIVDILLYIARQNELSLQTEKSERVSAIEKESKKRDIDIDSEAKARSSAITLLTEKIDRLNLITKQEIADRKSSLSKETKNRTNADEEINASIKKLASRVDDLEAAIRRLGGNITTV